MVRSKNTRFWEIKKISKKKIQKISPLGSQYPPGGGGVVPRLLVSGSNVSTFIGIWYPMPQGLPDTWKLD